MKKNLILHIGSPKTGTTSLQYFCFDNKEILKEKGIVYPSGINLTMAKAHHPLYFAITDDWWPPEFYTDITGELIPENEYKRTYHVEEFIQDLKRNANDSDTILLSSEGFFYCNEHHVEKLSDILADFNVQILLYLRPQNELLESLYRHYIFDSGARFTKSIDEFLKYDINKHLDYSGKISMWNKYFPESINVRYFNPDKLQNRNIIDDIFMNVLGIKEIINCKSYNTTVPAETIQFLKISNEYDLPTRKLASDFMLELINGYRGEKINATYLSSEQKRRILIDNAENNRVLEKKYFEGEPLFSEVALHNKSLESHLISNDLLKKEKIIKILNEQIILLENDVNIENLVACHYSLWLAKKNLLHNENISINRNKHITEELKDNVNKISIDKQAIVERLETIKKSSSREKQEFKKEIEGFRNTLRQKENELDSEKKNNSILKKEIESLRNTLRQKGNELESAILNNGILRKEIDKISSFHSKQYLLLEKYLSQCRILKEENSNLKNKTEYITLENNSLSTELGNLIGERDNLIGERDNLIGERDNLIGERDNLIGERDNLIGERDNLIGERDNLIGERDNLIGERDNLIGERDNLIGERDNLASELQHVYRSKIHKIIVKPIWKFAGLFRKKHK